MAWTVVIILQLELGGETSISLVAWQGLPVLDSWKGDRYG
jgi:hypothetical protein